METAKEDGQKMVTFIKKKVFNSNVYEAFLESAPQFILQCSIILRTGNISKDFEQDFENDIAKEKSKVVIYVLLRD